MNHAGDGDRASDEDCDDRDQQRAQADYRVEQSHRSTSGAEALFSRSAFTARLKPRPFKARTLPAPATLRQILVELTGIEPVASWLQTRRSPS